MNHFGYNNDLTRSQSADVPAIPTNKFDLSSQARVLFSDLAFYEAGIDFAESAAIAIAMRVSWRDKEVSRRLIETTVARLFDLIVDWASHTFVEHVLSFMKTLISLEDGLFNDRMEALFTSERGVLTILSDERQLETIYPNSNAIIDRYDAVVDSLFENPAVLAYFRQAAESQPLFRMLRDRNSHVRARNNGGNAPGDVVVGDFDLQHVVINVSGAGTESVNGDYVFKELIDSVGCFTHSAKYLEKATTFWLYRCKMSGGGHHWFISIPPDGHRPGTKDDLDFYTSTSRFDDSPTSQYGDRVPPRGNWSTCSTSFGAPPVLRYSTDLFVDTDSGRDDDSLNVGEDEVFDDSFSSLPGTPNDDFRRGSPSLYE